MKTTLMVRRKIEQILLIIQYNKQYIDCKESLKSLANTQNVKRNEIKELLANTNLYIIVSSSFKFMGDQPSMNRHYVCRNCCRALVGPRSYSRKRYKTYFQRVFTWQQTYKGSSIHHVSLQIILFSSTSLRCCVILYFPCYSHYELNMVCLILFILS